MEAIKRYKALLTSQSADWQNYNAALDWMTGLSILPLCNDRSGLQPGLNDRPVIAARIVWQTEWQACISCPDGMTDLSLLPGLNDRLVAATMIIWQTEWQSCHSCPALFTACHWHSQASMTELWLNTMATNNIPVKNTGLYTQWL